MKQIRAGRRLMTKLMTPYDKRCRGRGDTEIKASAPCGALEDLRAAASTTGDCPNPGRNPRSSCHRPLITELIKPYKRPGRRTAPNRSAC